MRYTHSPMNYLFVNGTAGKPAYQILSGGELQKFEPGEYQNPPSEVVPISASDVYILLREPLDKDSLVRRCTALFQRALTRDVVPAVTKEEESKLALLLEKARNSLK